MSEITDRQVCEAYAECRRNNRNADGSVRYPYHVLMEVTGATEDECLAAMERAYDDDLIEVGTSLRTGWLTDKGLRLLGLPEEAFAVIEPDGPAQPLMPGEGLIRSEAFTRGGITHQNDYTNMRVMQTTTVSAGKAGLCTMMGFLPGDAT